jgi:hypothetical protein
VRRIVHVSRSRWTSLSALAGYSVIAFGLLGVQPLVRGSTQFVGFGYDPQIFIWSLAWWPHAIAHGENPFVTHAIWAPVGVNLTWSTTIPGLALLFLPVTILAGPILAYDVAAVLMPAFAAWTAFRLCRYVTGSTWPSLVGGFLFGFSSYLIEQDGYGGHLNLGSVFLLPLVALTILRFLDGKLDGRGLVLRLAPQLALQVLFSTEVAFTLGLALVGAVALAALTVPARRPRLRARALPFLGACGIAALLTSPFLYYLISGGARGPFYSSPDDFDSDVLNFVVPVKTTLVGGDLLTGISGHFRGNLPEEGAYLGIPTLVILGLYARARWRTSTGRFLLGSIAVAAVAALGARLTVEGRSVMPLPWRVVSSLPVVDNVLTDRFVVYLALASAVVVALWTAERRGVLLRYAVPALAAVAILPNPVYEGFATTYHVPAFFTDSIYRSCIDPGETVLPFPTRGGAALLWQVDSGFRFNMAAGDIGPDIPVSFFQPPSVDPVAGGLALDAGASGILRTFLAGKNVTSIVLNGSQANDWAGAVDQIASPQVVGGVYLYHLERFPPSCAGP